MSTADLEKTVDQILYLDGFGSLSSLIASDSDHAGAIYKRFDTLAARDLLYYQSELAQLQAEQHQFDREDAEDVANPSLNGWEEIRRNTQDWALFKRAAETEPHDGRWRKRMDLAMKIRKTLKAYREALLLDHQVRALGEPDKQSMNTLSRAFRDSGHSVLTGSSHNLYPTPSSTTGDQYNDYAAVLKQPEKDLLTFCLKKWWPSWLHRRRLQAGTLTHALHPQMAYFSIDILNVTAHSIATILAAALLIAPMVSLYYVSKEKPITTISLIIMFTILFAGTIAFVTSAKRSEIFGATAAYAAVLVVFVSGDFANSNTT